MANTLKQARAGENVFSSPLSGIVVDTMIYSGTGRLNSAFKLGPSVSGCTVVFYDAHVATSGGPFAVSGHKILGALVNPVPVVSGIVAQIGTPVGQPVVFDAPFYSGLVAGLIGGSGINQFVVTFTSGVNA